MSVERPNGGERQPISPRKRIAVYSQLQNPINQDITPQRAGEMLEEGKVGGFKRFTPDNVWGSVIGTMIGDSPYGVRMGVVKPIIAQSLYSPDEFEQFARVTIGNEAQTAAELESRPTTVLTLKPESRVTRAVRTILRREQPEASEVALQRRQEWETETVLRHRNNAEAYRTLAEVVREIGEKYKSQRLSIEDIFSLTELDHVFSGKWNGTGRNLTFTDPDIREFGAQFQQVVERVWHGGRYLDESRDPQNPLSEEELFPERYPGR